MGLGLSIGTGPTPDPRLSPATSVEVHERIGEPTRYVLRYDLPLIDGDFPLASAKELDSGSVLWLVAPFGSKNHVLVKGPVIGQRLQFDHGGLDSELEVHGADTSISMDSSSKLAQFDGVSDADVVRRIVQQYSLTPDVAATPSKHQENKHTLIQRESDLQLIRRLAARNGMLFWVRAQLPPLETAHFKRAPLDARPVATLKLNQSDPNLRSAELKWDNQRTSSIENRQLDLNTKTAIDGSLAISPLPALGKKPFARVAPGRAAHILAPADDAGNLRARSEGALIDAAWFVSLRMTVLLENAGALIRAHDVVEVSGLGTRHSGKYFTRAVTHLVDASRHLMELELVRNGWE